MNLIFSTMPITCFGDSSRQGTYALFILLSKKLNLSFGRFLGGRKIPLDPGFYLYVGSALGNDPASMPLARRLVRHASRSSGKPPHKIRSQMIRFFKNNNLATSNLQPPTGKKLHWHIDYLLDSRYAQIINVSIIRSPLRLENTVSDFAESLDETFIIAPKLGAGDTTRGTHLLGVRNLETCICAFEQKVTSYLQELKELSSVIE